MTVRIKQATSWARAYWAALRTEGKDSNGKEPSDKWKKRMLLCEHSPIRTVEYDMAASVNAQALINISRKRLCGKASKETREAWRAVKKEMEKVDPVMASVMVPECVYRGFCPERKSCGFVNTEAYRRMLGEYRR